MSNTLTREQQNINFNWWIGMGRISKNVVWIDKGEVITVNGNQLAPKTLKGFVEIFENIGEENWKKAVVAPSGVDKEKVLKMLQQITKKQRRARISTKP